MCRRRRHRRRITGLVVSGSHVDRSSRTALESLPSRERHQPPEPRRRVDRPHRPGDGGSPACNGRRVAGDAGRVRSRRSWHRWSASATRPVGTTRPWSHRCLMARVSVAISSRLSLDPQRNLAAIPAGSCLDPGRYRQRTRGRHGRRILDLSRGPRRVHLDWRRCRRAWRGTARRRLARRGRRPDGSRHRAVLNSPSCSAVLPPRARCDVAGAHDDGTALHHLLDPSTARPVHHDREIVAATVVAGTAAWAEVWTKAVMVRGEAMLASSRSAWARCPGDLCRSVDRGQRLVADLCRIRPAAGPPRWR